MKIRISSLNKGLNKYSEQLSLADLQLDQKVFNGLIIVDFEIERGDGKIIVDMNVSSVGNFNCDRCGEDFNKEVSGSSSVVFVQREKQLPDEMPGDDLRSFMGGQETLDLSVEICDSLLLSIPMKNLCDNDCKGVCVRCGTNLNTAKCNCED